jgi:ketosteroid isomerase-like protein
VRAAEIAFAKSMADRDHEAFARHVSAEAVFFAPGGVTMRGKKAVVDGWAPLFEGPQAPFSWEPESVEVLPSGKLAFSAGPIRDPQGTRVGTYHSVWRLEKDGRWRVVFDNGCPPCG